MSRRPHRAPTRVPGQSADARPDASRASGPPGRLPRLLLVAGALLAVTFAAYAGALRHGFVNWDDMQYVGENPLVLGKHYGQLLNAVVSHHYHPLTMLSLAWNVSSPLTARPFIATNVALHLLNTLLVFWLVLLLARRRWQVAAFVALLFGVHPMHVESVAWVAERKDVLYAFFFLAGLIAYWEYLGRRTWRLLGLCFVLFVLSCLSKGQAVVFPAVLVLLDYWKGRPVLERRAVLEKLPFLAVSLLFGLIVIDAQAGRNFHGLLRLVSSAAPGFGVMPSFTPVQRAILPTYGYLMYALRLLVPVGLSARDPYPAASAASQPQYLAAPLFFAATLVLILWGLRRSRLIAFGFGWYLATLVSVLQWVPVGGAIMADRYTYLPYVGLLFMLGMGIQTLVERRPAARGLWVVSGLFAAVLFTLTVRQVAVWKDSETLWSRAIQLHPRLAMAYTSRGKDRLAASRTAAAMADFQTARRLGLRSADVYEGLGSCWVAAGRLDSALVMFDQAVRADPGRGRSYYNRAAVLLGLGRTRDALPDLDRALALLPAEAATILGARGYARMQLQQYRDALPDLDRAIAGGGADASAWYNRGLCRLRSGNRDGAEADFRAALRLDPAHAGARSQLQGLDR